MAAPNRPRSTTSDARSKLAEAHASLAAASAAVAKAEAAQDEARTDYWRAKDAVSEIEERMASISKQWGTAHHRGRDELRAAHDDCIEPLRAAKLPLLPLGKAVEAAEADLAEAQQHAAFSHARLHDAAFAATKAEVPTVVQPTIDQVEAAFATILAHGPDLFYLINSQILETGSLEPHTRRLLNIATTEWPAFQQKFQTSRWRGVVAMLEQDAEAPLPPVLVA